MRPLLPLLACSAFLLAACQTETGTEPAKEPINPPETTGTQTPVVEEPTAQHAETEPASEASSGESSTGTQATGLKAYIDPVTGELTVPPEEERIKQDSQPSSENEEGEEPPPELIPLEGGGYKIPLGDRYMKDSSATVPTEDSSEEDK